MSSCIKAVLGVVRFSLQSAAVLLLVAGLISLGCSSGQSDQPPGEDEASASGESGMSSDGSGSTAPSNARGANAAEDEAGASATTPGTASGNEATEVLQAMVAAYRNAKTYADGGTVRIAFAQKGEPFEQSADFSLTMERPDKIRLHAYQGMVVCDGEKLYGAILDMPNQVLVKDAPEEITLQTVFSDRMLASTLNQGFAGTIPQLVLMLAEDPLQGFLQQAEPPKLIENAKIDSHDCRRVQIGRPDGTLVLWIDADTHALRRVEFPTRELARMISAEGDIENLTLVADLAGANFGGEVPAEAFEFAVPEGAEIVKFFIPPNPAQLLGKPVPDFKFVDLEGGEITPATIEGKVVVLDFWATWCGPCRQSLPKLDAVFQKYADNDAVAIYAVSVDQPQTDDAELVAMFDKLGVGVPIVRDVEEYAATAFITTSIPSLFVIGPNGLVQDHEVGLNPKLEEMLPEKIEKLLAGEDIFSEPLKRYQQELERYGEIVESEDAGGQGGQEIPRAEIAEQTQPKTLELGELWTCTELATAGNVLPVAGDDGVVRLLVIDGWKSITEIDAEGKLVARHPLEIPQDQVVSFLRTATAGDGKRYFAVSASAQQQMHLLDGSLEQLWSFPQDAAENPHAGISDVQLADLDADGTPELYVGYWGVVGVQQVSLEGKRLWANRSIETVVRLAAGPPTEDAGRVLLASSNRGTLTKIDVKGESQGEISVAGRPMQWVVSSDLDNDGELEFCGLSAQALGVNTVVGFDAQGQEIWSFDLPKGVQEQPIEPIASGPIRPSGEQVWMIPGPDGSITFVEKDGTVLDSFNYGSMLSGLASVVIDGKVVLLVANVESLKAWQVTVP